MNTVFIQSFSCYIYTICCIIVLRSVKFDQIVMLFYHYRNFAFLFVPPHSFSIHCTPHFQQIHYNFTFYLSTSNVRILLINFFWFTMFCINLEHPKILFSHLFHYTYCLIFSVYFQSHEQNNIEMWCLHCKLLIVCQKTFSTLGWNFSVPEYGLVIIYTYINFTCIIACIVLMLTINDD